MPEVSLHDDVLLAYSTADQGNMDDRFADRSVVMQNRRKFYNQYGINPRFTIEAKQVHGDRILVLDAENSKMWYGMNIPGVDGFVTNDKEVNVIIKIADCAPVVIYDPEHHAIALLHVGWQGAVKRIHEKGLKTMTQAYGTDPKSVKVWVGPCAQKCCYTTNEQPKQIDEPAWSSHITQKDDHWHVDISGFVKETLKDQGVPAKNITIDNTCTVESEEFFSHTRSVEKQQSEGRFIVLAQLK